MAFLYLSPSTQEYNPYVNGGNEEYYMNLLADELEPYLHASGISFTRNTPDMTAATSIAASNAGDYDLHLALHSNATAGGHHHRHRPLLQSGVSREPPCRPAHSTAAQDRLP